MVLREGFLLELRGAIEAHDWAHNHVANFELGTDSTRGAGGNHKLRLHLGDDLRPHIDIRKLRSILRHVGIGLEKPPRAYLAILVVQYAPRRRALSAGQPARIFLEIEAKLCV